MWQEHQHCKCKIQGISSKIEAQNNLHGGKQTKWSSWQEESTEKQHHTQSNT
jgi:hypothetical protein